MAARIFQLFTLAAVAVRFAAASPTPQFVTVMDPVGSIPEPIYASIAGVDSQRHTTYEFELFDSLATDFNIVVAGSDYYSFTEAVISAGETFLIGGECGLAGSIATCTVKAPASTTVFTETGMGTIVFNTGAPVPGESGTAAPGTGTSGSGPTPTDKPNSGHRMSSSVLLFLVISLGLGYHLI
ncbi:hypothetical protein B0H13DRAFT_2373763 [Mycena leptocephala]|nr:hypothetical protein B0H13DRAFT_2373763 [Mycena leptocephala]